jgi:hypothetical protein
MIGFAGVEELSKGVCPAGVIPFPRSRCIVALLTPFPAIFACLPRPPLYDLSPSLCAPKKWASRISTT